MHPEEIKSRIRMKGTTPAAIADKLTVSSSAVSQVIHGEARSARIEQAIAKVIGLPATTIWANRRPSLRRKAVTPARARRAAA